MQIQLFVSNCEPIKVNKSGCLTHKFVLDGTIRNKTSISDFEIIIEKPNLLSIPYNYAYIPEFKRFYFLKPAENINNKLWVLNAHCDVLYTYATQILQSQVIIDKVEKASEADLFIDDGSFITENRQWNYILKFPNSLPVEGKNILICTGG